MALSKFTNQRERDKFVADASGDTCVRQKVSESALPSGAATLAKQDDILTELQAKADLTETQPVKFTNYALQFATDSGTSTTFYLGEAVIGSATSVAVWRIMRIQTATDAQIDWCDGDDSFNNVFDNRESLSYS